MKYLALCFMFCSVAFAEDDLEVGVARGYTTTTAFSIGMFIELEKPATIDTITALSYDFNLYHKNLTVGKCEGVRAYAETWKQIKKIRENKFLNEQGEAMCALMDCKKCKPLVILRRLR